MAERRIDCGEPGRRLICDEIVPAAEMEAALERTVEKLTGSGVVSAPATGARSASPRSRSISSAATWRCRPRAGSAFQPRADRQPGTNWDAAAAAADVRSAALQPPLYSDIEKQNAK